MIAKTISATAKPRTRRTGLADVILECEVIAPFKDEAPRVGAHVNDQDVLAHAFEEVVGVGR